MANEYSSLKDMRDELIKKQYEYENFIKSMDNFTSKLQQVLSKVSANRLLLESNGIEVSKILNVDYDKLKTDKEYLDAFKSNYISVISNIKELVSDVLNG